ncbi:MAG: F0F1 ATP synthase subunit B [Gammaproteobacteria bacterium]|nr:F0F1 ATP synthase subunit B [Gammaproteobacteria bacterium]
MFAAAPLLVLAAEERSGLFLILPEIHELIWGIVSFAVLVFMLWKFAGPALNRTLEARQQAVVGGMREAEEAKLEAQGLLDDYREQLANAKEESNRIIEEARQTAEAMRSELLAKAQAEAEETVAKARSEVAAERERALAEVRQEVANLSIDLAERVVQGSLDREAQEVLIGRYLEELERMG